MHAEASLKQLLEVEEGRSICSRYRCRGQGEFKVGVGVHAEVGYADGVFKFDAGASLDWRKYRLRGRCFRYCRRDLQQPRRWDAIKDGSDRRIVSDGTIRNWRVFLFSAVIFIVTAVLHWRSEKVSQDCVRCKAIVVDYVVQDTHGGRLPRWR